MNIRHPLSHLGHLENIWVGLLEAREISKKKNDDNRARELPNNIQTISIFSKPQTAENWRRLRMK